MSVSICLCVAVCFLSCVLIPPHIFVRTSSLENRLLIVVPGEKVAIIIG